MKAQSQATIRFSGYPLRIVESKHTNAKAELVVIRSLAYLISFTKNRVTNDPRNWDPGWFANYE